jgi:hypothetical protein
VSLAERIVHLLLVKAMPPVEVTEKVFTAQPFQLFGNR